MAGEMNAMIRHLAMLGLRECQPGASERKLRRRLAGLLLGEELATKANGPLEDADTDTALDPPRATP